MVDKNTSQEISQYLKKCKILGDHKIKFRNAQRQLSVQMNEIIFRGSDVPKSQLLSVNKKQTRSQRKKESLMKKLSDSPILTPVLKIQKPPIPLQEEAKEDESDQEERINTGSNQSKFLQIASEYSIIENKILNSQPKQTSIFFRKYQKSGTSSKVSFDDNSSQQKSKQSKDNSKQVQSFKREQNFNDLGEQPEVVVSGLHSKNSSGLQVEMPKKDQIQPSYKKLGQRQKSYGPGTPLLPESATTKRFKSVFAKKEDVASLDDFIQSSKGRSFTSIEKIATNLKIGRMKAMRKDHKKISIFVFNEEPRIKSKCNASEDECQLKEYITVQNYIEVSKTWKKVRKAVKLDNKEDYFAHMLPKKRSIQNCYLNPFRNNHLLFCSLVQKDGTLFLVNAKLCFSQNMEQITHQIVKAKDKLSVKLNFLSLDSKRGNQPQQNKLSSWEDTLVLPFRDFIKWFVEDYSLSQMITRNGFTKKQKINIIFNIYQNIAILECRLKLDYFKKKLQKKGKRKLLGRKDIFVAYIVKLEEWFKRDQGAKRFITHFDQFLFQNPFFRQFYQLLKDQRAKQDKHNSRIKRRLVSRQLNHSSIQLEARQLVQKNNYPGPSLCLINPEAEFQHLLQKEQGNNTLKIPYELHRDLLGHYNSLRQMHQTQYYFQIKSHSNNYLFLKVEFKQMKLHEVAQIKLYQPFSKKTWQRQTMSKQEKNKFINLAQIEVNHISCGNQRFYNQSSRLKELNLLHNLKILKTPIGIKSQLLFHQSSYVELSAKERFLLDYLQGIKTSNKADFEEYFRFLSIQKTELLCSETNSLFWKNQFIEKQATFQCNIQNFGRSIIYCQIFHAKNIQNVCLIKLTIYKQCDMKMKYYKVVLTQNDIINLFKQQNKNQVEVYTQNDSLSMTFSLNLIHSCYRCKWSLTKLCLIQQILGQECLILISIRIDQCRSKSIFQLFARLYLLKSKFPWVKDFQYNFCRTYPCDISNQFYFYSNTSPKLLISYYKKISILKQPPLNSIIQIYQLNELNCLIIIIYFPKNQRKFIAQIDFSSTAKEQLMQIQEFIIINSLQLALSIPSLNIICVLQELLYFTVKRMEKNGFQQESLITITMDSNLQLSDNFKSVKILDSEKYKLSIKLQWLNHQERIQTSILPLPEILLGYSKQQNIGSNAFNYKFNQKDFIKLSVMVIEIVSLNWSRQHLQQEYFQQIDKLPNATPTLKINSSVSLSQIISYQNSQQTLMYRGLLMKQTVLAIFKDNENYIYGFVQRLTDGKKLEKKYTVEEIDNFLPGFVELLKRGSKEDLGRKLFLLLKNNMIFQCFCQF